MNQRMNGQRFNWAEDLPEFCSWSLLLVAVILAQIGCLLVLLGSSAPWSWPTLGILSLFSIWATMLVQAFWCITGQLLVVAVNKTAIGQRPGRFGWSLCWLLLWLEAIVVCMSMAQLVILINNGAALNLISDALTPSKLVLTTGVISALLAGVLLRYTAIWQRWHLQTRQQARMELENLQARLRPHFLYNTLNTIAALITQKPNDAIDAVEDLSDLLRQSLQPKSRLVTLTQEIQLCKQYLQLMQWRLGERLQTDWRIDPDLITDNWKIPPLTLQALVENAVLHGIQPLPDGGLLSLQLNDASSRLQIVVSNPIAGDTTRENARANGTGTAILDLQRRLGLVYQGGAQLQQQKDRDRYTVTLELPHG